MSPSREGRRPLVAIHRAILDEPGWLCAWGVFTPVFEEYAAHRQRWSLEADPLGLTMMRQALAGACLQLAFRPPEESIGWTLNFAAPPTNIFVAGDSHSHEIVGRIFTENVETSAGSRLFVQTQRPEHPTTQSIIPFQGWDVLDVFEEYHRHSEQVLARFFEWDEDRFAVVKALPGADLQALADLAREEAEDRISHAEPSLDKREFAFRCHCDALRILDLLRGIFAKNPDDLFHGQATVQTQCPRCGALWEVERRDFDSLGENN